MTTPDLVRLKVFSDGVELSSTVAVLGVEVLHAVNRLPAATLTLHDGDVAARDFPLSNEPTFACGRRIEIRAGYHGQEDTIFDGVIVKHALRARRGGRTTLVLECRHAAVKATLEKKSAIFADVKDSQLIEDLLGLHGIAASVRPTTVEHRQLVQAHATDWDFILHRAEANGLLLFVEDERVVLAPPDTDSDPVVRMTFGGDLFEFEAESDARLQPAQVTATTWNMAAQAPAQATAGEPAFETPGDQRPSELADGMGSPTERLVHGALAEDELQAWGDAWALRSRMALTRGRLVCQGDARLRPGVTAEVVGCGDRFSGRVFVTAVRHGISQGNWRCDVQFGLDPECFGGDGLLVPPADGLHVGVVTALEGDPEGEDRIRIRLPLVDGAGEGIWARLSALDAGADRGSVFRPEIGDEVVVGFVSRDPRRPIVLGKLFSSAKTPPIGASDDNPQKGFVTRSGLRLLFDDEERSLTLSTPGGKSLSIDDEADELLLRDEHGNQLLLSRDGITIETRGKLTIKAAQDASIEGANVAVEAKAAFTASGNSSAELTSSGVSKVKGSLVQIN